MTVTDLLAAIRNKYAATLAKAISHSSGAHSEPAFRIHDPTLAKEGLLSVPCRADLIPTQGVEAGKSITVDSETQLSFEPLSFSLSQTLVHLSPFAWDWVNLQVIGLSPALVSGVVVPWFMQWFDEEDENSPTSDGLNGVIHFVSDPEVLGESVVYKLDLGSASESALEDLLFRLSDAGASEVRIG